MFSASNVGKKRRMDKLLCNNKTLIVPIDDSLIFGPQNGLQNIHFTLSSIESQHPNAILGFKGSLMNLNISSPFILNVTASTVLGNHVQKAVTSTVKDALVLGVDAIAIHINYTSDYENEMLNVFSMLSREADGYGMPVLAISYPRKTKEGLDYNYEDLFQSNNLKYTDLICHCVRSSVELGADIVKTQFTGSINSFKKVIDCAMGIPVVIAGGPLVDVKTSYKKAFLAIQSGASGISFGRNVFNSKNISAYIFGLKKIIFENYDYESAYNSFRDFQKMKESD